MLNLIHRGLTRDDLDTICGFARTTEELFYVSPKFQFPLTPEQILKLVENRYSPTVIATRETPAPLAYANLYDMDEENLTCWLGNVIVSPIYRGRGVAPYLISAMMNVAKHEHGSRTLKLYCHNTNTRALLFYCKSGFTPCGSKIVVNSSDQKIAAIEMQKEL